MSTARWIRASSAALLVSRIASSSGDASRNRTSGIAPPQIVGELLLARRRAPAMPRSCEQQPDFRAPGADRREKRRHRRRRVSSCSATARRQAAALEQRVDERANRRGDSTSRDAGRPRHFVPATESCRSIARSTGRDRWRKDHLAPLALAGQQHERRVGRVHAGQVQQVVFLPERPVDVAGATGGLERERDEDAVRPDRFRERRPPRLILGRGDGGDVWLVGGGAAGDGVTQTTQQASRRWRAKLSKCSSVTTAPASGLASAASGFSRTSLKDRS